MRDFAYLFSDSAAAWLRGRGDARFRKYERHYRADRASANEPSEFDLEASNEKYATLRANSRNRLVRILDSRIFKSFFLFLALLWGGSLLLNTFGKSQPVALGIALAALFVAIRIKGRRSRGGPR
jgi:hypothetical protein